MYMDYGVGYEEVWYNEKQKYTPKADSEHVHSYK